MKRYLTFIFIFLSVVILVVGLRMDFQWNGVVAWGLSFICFILAAYFTMYIQIGRASCRERVEFTEVSCRLMTKQTALPSNCATWMKRQHSNMGEKRTE